MKKDTEKNIFTVEIVYKLAHKVKLFERVKATQQNNTDLTIYLKNIIRFTTTIKVK